MNSIKIIISMIVALSCLTSPLGAAEHFITTQHGSNSMALYEAGVTASILLYPNADKGIQRAVSDLQNDYRKVTGHTPYLINSFAPAKMPLIIIGTIGTHSAVDDLIAQKKFDALRLKGKREMFLIEHVTNPCEGMAEAIVIAGSDKRGTIYGIYELSEQMGVSPWYYWADVPVERKEALYFHKGSYSDGEPAVTYRGIFLNDEAPALSGWAKVTFGGFNSAFYEKVFELILRLRANFLWPAMWGSAFYDDDPQNGVLANEMGIIMGTSHHEPMAMAQTDWHRYVARNNLPNIWDYNKNAEALQQAWKYGIERSRDWEKVVTVGMRGDGDEAMEEGVNIALLEKIVSDQRKIIEEVTGKKADQTPQVWALYKEVQDYYDHGMRVPDDVTLLLCDDNWGNIRKLPNINAKPRKGGYGIYYHFDYVGAPRNSKWININPIQRVWEQMSLAYEHGVDRLWIVNVGDLKPMEYPIHFFLDMAWDPRQFNPHNLVNHTEQWAAQQFGASFAKEIAHILTLYPKYNRRVTPELLNEHTYSLENYGEFERVVHEYRSLALEAFRIYTQLPAEYRDAYYQLVLYPVNACSNLYEMYYAVAKNQQLAAAKDLRANQYADIVKECFARDSLLQAEYNTVIAGGKWAHMMDQTRIGYTSWQEPPRNIMPQVTYVTPEEAAVEKIFLEQNGYVSIEAENFVRHQNGGNIRWEVIPHFGKTLSGVTTLPQNEYPSPDEEIYLEYDILFETAGEIELQLLLAPTLNFNDNKGLRYEVSFDGEAPQLVNFNGHYRGELGQWQAEHIIRSIIRHTITEPGIHTLRYRVMDPGIVLQKILIDTGGLKPSYLGPPESNRKTPDNKLLKMR
jgi:hypothetical protein